jgi:hypothetical protein
VIPWRGVSHVDIAVRPMSRGAVVVRFHSGGSFIGATATMVAIPWRHRAIDAAIAERCRAHGVPFDARRPSFLAR